MPQITNNSYIRQSEKCVIYIKMSGEYITEYKEINVSSFINNYFLDSTKLKVKSGFSLTNSVNFLYSLPSGDKKALTNDLNASFEIIKQSTQEAENLQNTFNNKNCDLIILYSIDSTLVNKKIAILKNIKVYFTQEHSPLKENILKLYFSKKNLVKNKNFDYKVIKKNDYDLNLTYIDYYPENYLQDRYITRFHNLDLSGVNSFEGSDNIITKNYQFNYSDIVTKVNITENETYILFQDENLKQHVLVILKYNKIFKTVPLSCNSYYYTAGIKPISNLCFNNNYIFCFLGVAGGYYIVKINKVTYGQAVFFNSFYANNIHHCQSCIMLNDDEIAYLVTCNIDDTYHVSHNFKVYNHKNNTYRIENNTTKLIKFVKYKNIFYGISFNPFPNYGESYTSLFSFKIENNNLISLKSSSWKSINITSQEKNITLAVNNNGVYYVTPHTGNWIIQLSHNLEFLNWWEYTDLGLNYLTSFTCLDNVLYFCADSGGIGKTFKLENNQILEIFNKRSWACRSDFTGYEYLNK